MSGIISLDEARRAKQRRLPLIPDAASQSMQAMALVDIAHQINLAYAHPLPLHDLLFVDDQGRPLTIRWFHKEWASLILNHRAVLIEAPRGTGKSSFLETVIAWYIGRNPDIRVLILCENDSQAEKRLIAIKEILTEHPLYKMVFPHIELDKSKKNTQSQLYVARPSIGIPHPTIEARGITSAGAGNRSDLMVLDDPVSYRNAIQYPKLQEEVIQKFLNDWHPTLSKNGRFVSIFTPWKKNDLNGYLKASGGYVHKRYAHGRPGDMFHSIFPELYSREKLEAERTKMGYTNYARAYLCQAVPEGAVVIPEHFLQTYTELELTRDKLTSAIGMLSIDPASGKEVSKTGQLDYFGYGVGLAHIPMHSTSSRPRVPLIKDSTAAKRPPRSEVFIPEGFRTKVTQTQAARLAIQLAVQWGVQHLLCEAQGLSELHSRIMEARDRIPGPARPNFQVHPITTGPVSKGQRLLNMTCMLETDEEIGVDRPTILFHPRVIDPYPQPFYLTLQDGSNLEAMRTLRSETLDFPTAHDDVLDQFTQMANWARVFLLPDYSESPRSSRRGGLSAHVL